MLKRVLRHIGGVAGISPRILRPSSTSKFALVDWAGAYQLDTATQLYPAQSLETPSVQIGHDYQLVLKVVRAGLGVHSGTIRVDCFPAAAQRWRTLASIELPPDSERRICLDLAGLEGPCRFRLVRSGRVGSPCTVSLFRISASTDAGRVNALSGYDARIKAEVEHFGGNAYTHRMYGAQQDSQVSEGLVEVSSPPSHVDESARVNALSARARERLEKLPSQVDEATFNYAMRALAFLLPMSPPSFFERAGQLSATKPLRILSILAGAARVEEQIVAHCKGPVDLTLLDASESLIQRAADRLVDARSDLKVQCLVGDINTGLPGEGEFDLIVCVSALHHVAELELVLGQINARLKDDGEFWSIGEQIGRNGNRLWPGAYAAANHVFATLPPRLRMNAHTNQVDEVLTDRDFSEGCFEGIRSEELETLLEAHLIPVDVYKRNAFLWRLVDATYADNYRLDQKEDLGLLRDIIAAEFVHWACGGRSTELHGVYRKKRLNA